jgi:hypothetical protein
MPGFTIYHIANDNYHVILSFYCSTVKGEPNPRARPVIFFTMMGGMVVYWRGKQSAFPPMRFAGGGTTASAPNFAHREKCIRRAVRRDKEFPPNSYGDTGFFVCLSAISVTMPIHRGIKLIE